MSQPKSLNAYQDCEKYFEQALESKHGIAVHLETAGLAVQFKAKMNSYREKIRKQSKAVYPPDHPSYGTSPYDAYQLTTDPSDPCRIRIKPYTIQVQKVEPLTPED